MKRILFQSGVLLIVSGLLAVNAGELLGESNQMTVDLVKIFEVVIAGIVASALVLALLALFIGQWSGKKQNAAIKLIRQEVDKNKEDSEELLTDVRDNARAVRQLVDSLEKKVSAMTNKQHQAWIHMEDIEQMVEDADECSVELKQTTGGVHQRMEQIQRYWDGQLKETTDIVQRVQLSLEEGLTRVETGLAEIQENDMRSKILAQKVLEAYQQQAEVLSKHGSASDELSNNLQKVFNESESLLKQLHAHTETAERSFQHFNQELGAYESQAYEQFDGAFQATDIARKELTANVNESRQHVENLRRYEAEGRSIKLQARDHLASINSKAINEFSSTLENTQKMFSTLQDNVQDAQYAIDSLRKMKHQITAYAVEDANAEDSINRADELMPEQAVTESLSKEKQDSKAISGDSTLISFFSSRK